MSPKIRTRGALIGAAVVMLSLAIPVHRSSAEPCDAANAGHGPSDPGWQVQVDPETGVYSMPSPGVLDTPTGRAASAATTGVVITPGRSAAGGFKATFDDDALVHEKVE